ncbi:MAG: DUF4158 domain-containing protein [Candidatus Margulisbacteria bacterium]|nr:DUF4158 domain-containing protein [Candidatus Margulisiibacteriota bacterium]
MPALKILNNDDKTQFESPPDFDSAARKKFFRITSDIRDIVDSFNPIRKVGFILQFSYFKYTSKFFSPAKFNSKDVDYVCNQLNIPTVSLDSYYGTTLTRHRELILKTMGFDAFSVHKKSVHFNFENPLRCSSSDPFY